jgi:formylglycine-generating enzyme required for sulfatase activity
MTNSAWRICSVILCVPVLAHAAVFDVFALPTGQTSLQLVPVGNAGNLADTRYSSAGFGAVDHAYNIGRFEVTTAQYTQLLNAVAQTDPYGLYTPDWNTYSIQRSGAAGGYSYTAASDWANRPLNNVTWAQAMRFANWLTKGQPIGAEGTLTTEDGSYALNGAMTDAALALVGRKPGARYVLPTDDEWYKAAYHKNDGVAAHYWDYPTRSNTKPGNHVLLVDDGNSANYYDGAHTIGPPYLVTPVGEFENSFSAYGTFDQGGNVREFNETLNDDNLTRALRGGYFGSSDLDLKAGLRWSASGTLRDDGLGFRIAEVPEPNSVILLIGGAGGLTLRSRRRR